VLTSLNSPTQIDAGIVKDEWLTCSESCAYFIDTYCRIYEATERTWIPFALWPEQYRALKVISNDPRVVILKARQLGITWLVLAYALWMMLFRPAATVLLFSRRDDEAIYLLGDERLKGMYNRLPAWMQARSVIRDNGHEWELSNGSIARAFPTSAGDSYTATLVICDEFDLVINQGELMNAVKPTIDGGGQMILLSRSDNEKPESHFKQIYRAAKTGKNGWAAVFLPWNARPSRTAQWYALQVADILSRTGSLDDLHQQYPATDMEALSPRSLAKRIAPDWLLKCFTAIPPIQDNRAPAIPGLRIFSAPQRGRPYVIGADPAEGNPTSDASSAHVLDVGTGEEVAHLSGRLQPSTFAAHLNSLGTYFNAASLLVERNNHGHAVLLWLRDNSRLHIMVGEDGKQGWHSTSLGKSLMYNAAADAFRDGSTILHSENTYHQLASIEGSTLRAPEGEHDDEADSYALALVARTRPRSTRMSVAVA
jgi:hypothetical protein